MDGGRTLADDGGVLAAPPSASAEWIALGQDDWRITVRDWLRDAFAESPLTQEQLGERVGVSQTQIGKYLFGTDLPGDDKLPLLGDALKRPPPSMFIMRGVAEGAAGLQDQTEQLLVLWRALSFERRVLLIQEAERLASR